jgi:PAS domain S-box-containing protein
LLLLVLLAVTPALGLILAIAVQQRTLAAERAREDVRQLAELAAVEQEQLIAGTRQLLVTLAKSFPLEAGDVAVYGRYFVEIKKHSPWYANIGVIAPNGDMVFSAAPTTGPVNLADRRYFQRVLQTRDFVIGDYHEGRITGKPVIAFAYPVLDETSQVVAVVHAGVDLSWLDQAQSVIEKQLPKGASLVVTDGNGTVLVHKPNPEKWIGRRLLDKPLFQTILAQREGLIESPGWDGIPCFYAFTPVRSMLRAGDIFVVVGTPKAAVFAEPNRLLARSLTWFALVAMLALAAAWFGADVVILHRVDALVRATGRLTAGDLGARAGPPYREGEIGQLSHAFDQMAETLQQRNAERDRAEEQQKALTAGLHAVVMATDELIACPDLDTLCRRAVELAREKLGVERCAIFLEKDGYFHGTYGTDLARRTTDEHANSVKTEAPAWYQNIQALRREDRRWTTVEEPQWEWNGEKSVIIGHGWVTVTPIQSQFAEKHIGVFTNDAAITKSALDPIQQEVVALFCSLLGNIIERKQAEQALRRSEEYFRSLIENTSDIIAVLNADRTIRYASPSVERILGYQPEELVGRNVTEVIHPEETQTIAHRMEEAIQKPRFPVSVDFRAHHKDGSWRILEGVGKNLLENPAVAGFIANVRDITERTQLEERLRQSQKMEAVGKLAGGVAHDFNNLLTAVTGYCDLLLVRLGESDPLRNEVWEIRKAGERATSLTRQLLAFSRRQMLQPKVIKINRTIAEMGKMLQRLIGEDVDLVTVLDAQLGCVKVDPSQIEQVVMNLAVNARDAMSHGGRLTIETSNVDLDEAYARRHAEVQPGPYVLIAVSDTGCGMDAETQSRIFEPFFTTKEVGRGTGLGLSMIYGIVKQSGGHVWVYSEIGKGTTFKIYFPRVEGPAEEDESVSQRAALTLGSETVLLVEDEDEVRKLVREILELNGYTVLEVSRGLEAIQTCRQYEGPIHLILTDVVMPGMSGRELVERMIPLRPQMRVLYMSGYTENAIVHHGVLDEGTAFIQKPFTPAALARKVRDVLDETP